MKIKNTRKKLVILSSKHFELKIFDFFYTLKLGSLYFEINSTENILKMKSMMAEKATIELIRQFIGETDLSSVDKYDFIDFNKLFQQVSVYSDGDFLELCNLHLIMWFDQLFNNIYCSV